MPAKTPEIDNVLVSVMREYVLEVGEAIKSLHTLVHSSTSATDLRELLYSVSRKVANLRRAHEEGATALEFAIGKRS